MLKSSSISEGILFAISTSRWMSQCSRSVYVTGRASLVHSAVQSCHAPWSFKKLMKFLKKLFGCCFVFTWQQNKTKYPRSYNLFPVKTTQKLKNVMSDTFLLVKPDQLLANNYKDCHCCIFLIWNHCCNATEMSFLMFLRGSLSCLGQISVFPLGINIMNPWHSRN